MAAIMIAVTLFASLAAALPEGIEAEEYVTGLQFPVAMAILPDGGLLVTEKFGTVRIVRDGLVDPTPAAHFDVLGENERGLFGIQLLPNFASTGEFIVTYTPVKDLHSIYLSRLRWTGSRAEILDDPWLELPSSPDTDRHYGGNMRFDAAGRLYVSASDLDDPGRAQDLDSWSGKILRFEADLSIPEDNPFPGSPIFAYGLRNTFDFDIGPDGEMYGGENGHHHHDELNHIVAGANYGWPLVHGKCDHVPLLEVCKEGTIPPLHEFRNRTGPTGLVVYDGEMMPELEGDILFGGWHSGQVHRFKRRSANDVELMDQFFVIPGGPHPVRPGDERQHLGDYGVVDVDVAADGAVLVMVTGLNVGTIYRIAPTDELLNADLVVSEGKPRTSDDDLCQVSRVGASTTAGVSAFFLAGVVLGLLMRRSRRTRAGLSALAVVAALLWAPRADAAPLHYGAQIGINHAKINGDNDFVAEWANGFAAGGVLRYQLIDYFAVQPELLYSQKGSGIVATDERLRSHYLTLPILAQGMLPLGPITPRLFAGPSLSLLLAAKTGDDSVTKLLHRFELGFFGGVGLDIKLWSERLTVDFQYERGLSELYDADAVPATQQYETDWNNVFYLMIGFVH